MDRSRFFICDFSNKQELDLLRSSTYSAHIYGSQHGAVVKDSSLFAFLAQRYLFHSLICANCFLLLQSIEFQILSGRLRRESITCLPVLKYVFSLFTAICLNCLWNFTYYSHLDIAYWLKVIIVRWNNCRTIKSVD